MPPRLEKASLPTSLPWRGAGRGEGWGRERPRHPPIPTGHPPTGPSEPELYCHVLAPEGAGCTSLRLLFLAVALGTTRLGLPTVTSMARTSLPIVMAFPLYLFLVWSLTAWLGVCSLRPSGGPAWLPAARLAGCVLQPWYGSASSQVCQYGM